MINNSKVIENIDRLEEKFFSHLKLSKLLAIHFFLCSLGLVVVAMFISGQLAKLIDIPPHLTENLYPWAQSGAGVKKIVSLVQYVVPIVVMTAYLPFAAFITRRFSATYESVSREKFPKLWLFYLILIVVNLGLLVANKDRPTLMVVLSLLWIFTFLWFPISIILNRWIWMPTWVRRHVTALMVTTGAIAVISYLFVFIPMLASPVNGHDYVNLSQKTVLADGMVVDNLDYFNERQIEGLQLYDPRKSAEGILIKVEDCDKIYKEMIKSDSDNATKLGCDQKSNNLLVKAPFISLESALGNLWHKKTTSDQEKDFVLRNTIKNPGDQKLKGWFFFHHGYNFGPMSAMSLGAPYEKQTMVYGWLSTVTQGKILESLGAMNYQGYFKLFYSVYILYFAVYLLGVWLIFRAPGTVAMAGLLLASAVLMLGSELIKLAPGFNPARHFFDVPTFYLLYRYFSENKATHLLLAVAMSLFAVLWSKDLGLFLATSVGGALVAYAFIGSLTIARLPLIIGILTAFAGLIIYVSPLPGQNPTSIYMILGVGSPIADTQQVFSLLTWVGILVFATLWIKQALPYRALTIGLALYFVQGMTYYIWYPETHHLWGIAPVFIGWLVALYHGWTVSPAKQVSGDKQLIVVGMLGVFLFLPALLHFNKNNKQQTQTQSHQLYQWDFPRANISTATDPALFKEAVALIQKYSPEKKIYIISKYDHLLPILAGRYSAMPYNELLTNLVSKREVDDAAQTILENHPQYLFVDNDIDFGFREGQLEVNSVDSLAERAGLKLQKYLGEAVARERVTSGLYDVYKKVSAGYQKCGSSGLISVYCRKAD